MRASRRAGDKGLGRGLVLISWRATGMEQSVGAAGNRRGWTGSSSGQQKRVEAAHVRQLRMSKGAQEGNRAQSCQTDCQRVQLQRCEE